MGLDESIIVEGGSNIKIGEFEELITKMRIEL
jgi:hypothetical protein